MPVTEWGLPASLGGASVAAACATTSAPTPDCQTEGRAVSCLLVHSQEGASYGRQRQTGVATLAWHLGGSAKLLLLLLDRHYKMPQCTGSYAGCEQCSR